MLLVLVSLQAAAVGWSAPLWQDNKPDRARRLVVISDTHLSAGDSFSKLVKNRPRLAEFLQRLAETKDVDELVIAGDFIDGWSVPFSFSAKDWDDFYVKAAVNNAELTEYINSLIRSGVKVTYVPGNHDMTLSKGTVEKLFPGINQARDADGLGVYRTGVRNEIVIEHGHRYSFQCAPAPGINSAVPGLERSFLPPGYFFSRMAAESKVEGKSLKGQNLPQAAHPAPNSPDRRAAWFFYIASRRVLKRRPLNVDSDARVIPVDMTTDGPKVAVVDLLPVPGTGTKAALFRDYPKRWEQVQKDNGVRVPVPFPDEMENKPSASLAAQAQRQYFAIDRGVDVVVFGHSHHALLKTFNVNGRIKFYANSGAWIDSIGSRSCTFVRITSMADSDSIDLMQLLPDGKTVLFRQTKNR